MLRISSVMMTVDAGLAALCEGGDQVDDLDAGFEDFHLGRLLVETRGNAVNRGGCLGANRSALVDRLANHVQNPSQRFGSDRDRDCCADVANIHSAAQAVGGAHRDRTHPVVAEVLLRFEDQGPSIVEGHFERVVDLGKSIGRE